MSPALLRQFPPLVWIVVFGTFLIRTGFYMVWPFISILLYREHGMSAGNIGLLLAGTALVSTVVGFYGGWLSDKFGRRLILLLGCLISLLCYALIGISHHLLPLGLAVVGSGLSSGMIDAPGKALLADSLESPKARELALHLRYFLLNLGAALGPLLGVTLGISARQQTFLLLAGCYGVLGLAFVWGFHTLNHKTGGTVPKRSGTGLRDVFAVLRRDPGFMLLILANLLMTSVYAQFNSPLVQYLDRAGTPDVAKLIALLITLNAVTVVTLQFPLLWLLRNWPIRRRLQLGITLFMGAQLLFAGGDTGSWHSWIMATILLSSGEVLLFPLLNVLIDQMAPPHLKGSYFGAGALAGLGTAGGTWIGGLFISGLGGPALYLLMACICLLIALLYGWSARYPRPYTQPVAS